MVENGTVGLGLATAHHEEIKTGCRYVELIRLHILVNCMELRWRQPCSDPVATCKFTKSYEKESQIRSFTSLQIVHTHTHCAVFRAPSDLWSLRGPMTKDHCDLPGITCSPHSCKVETIRCTTCAGHLPDYIRLKGLEEATGQRSLAIFIARWSQITLNQQLALCIPINLLHTLKR